MKHLLITVALALASCSLLLAQQVISSAGNTSSSANAIISWTLGEPVIGIIASGEILSQGFHQTNLFVTAIDEPTLSGIEINVFPNPTEDHINIKVNRTKKVSSLIVYDMTGKVLIKKQIKSNNTHLNFSQYSSGIYLLRVLKNNNQPIQTFKIIKQ